MVPKPNSIVHLHLDPATLNVVLIRPVHRGPAVNDMFLKVTNVCCITLVDAHSGYHNLKLDKKSSYSATFACQFGRYRYARQPLGVAPVDNMI